MRTWALLLVVALAGCEGPMGPTGPAGPQGLPGPAGPVGAGTRAVYTATVGASGGATVQLPAAAGTSAASPPALACYLGQVGGTVWLSVAGTPSTASPSCGLVFQSGTFNAVMISAPPGWVAVFVVVY